MTRAAAYFTGLPGRARRVLGTAPATSQGVRTFQPTM